jgi:hypothetical protein
MTDSVHKLRDRAIRTGRLLNCYSVVILGLSVQLLAPALDRPPGAMRAVAFLGLAGMIVGMPALLLITARRLRTAALEIAAAGI